MKHNKLTALLAVLAVSALGVGALSYYSGTAEKKQNDFNIVAGQKDQNDAGTIIEDKWNPDNAKNMQPGQIVEKNPVLKSNVEYTAQAFLKVNVPTVYAQLDGDAEDKIYDAAVPDFDTTSGKWKLIRASVSSTIDKKSEYIFGYVKPLPAGDRTTELFTYMTIPPFTHTNAFTGSVDISGSLIQTEGAVTLDDAVAKLGIEKTEGAENIHPELSMNTYIIQYEANAPAGTTAAGVTNNSSHRYNVAKSLTTNGYSVDGYVFTGWNTEADGTGTAYDDDASVKNLTSINGATVNLYAQWKKNEKTASIDNNKLKTKIQANKATLTSFVRATEEPSADVMVTTDNIVSTSDSTTPVYAWINDNKTVINWYSEADKPKLGQDCSEMFSGCTKLAGISGLSSLDTGNTTNMYSMFYDCNNLTDISWLSSWDTGNVTNIQWVFGNCIKLTDISSLSSWNTEKVTSMSGLFAGCTKLANISGISPWNTGSVTDMSGMFSGCMNLTDISGLSSWNTGHVTSIGFMFYGCTSITNASAINDWDILKVTDFTGMFNECHTHPTFTKRAGTWDSNGTFTPST